MTLPSQRRVARISNHGNVDVTEVPFNPPGPGEVLIQVVCSVISPGTELGMMRAPRTDVAECWYEFGYQNSGIVVDANGCVGLQPGDRVACMGANYAQHSNWAVVPQHLTWKLPDALSFEEGAFANLLGTAVNAVRRAQIQFGDHMAVVGLGIVGQLVAQIATLSGAHVIGLDQVAMRQELALRLGAESVAQFDSQDVSGWKQKYTRGYGLDSGVVAFGGDASAVLYLLAAAMRRAPDSHNHGRIVIVGGAKVNVQFPGEFGNIDVCSSSRTGPGYHDKVWERGGEYPEALVPWNTRRNVEECFHFVQSGRLQLKPLITHHIQWREIPAMCRELVDHPDKALAVVVRYEEESSPDDSVLCR